MTQSLYESDILLWVEDTVAKLKAHDFENLDIENLIEEVDSLGISQKKELLSRLITLLEHLNTCSKDSMCECQKTIEVGKLPFAISAQS